MRKANRSALLVLATLALVACSGYEQEKVISPVASELRANLESTDLPEHPLCGVTHECVCVQGCDVMGASACCETCGFISGTCVRLCRNDCPRSCKEGHERTCVRSQVCTSPTTADCSCELYCTEPDSR